MTLGPGNGHASSAPSLDVLLADLLDREWVAQSARTQPLRISPAVKERIELAVAASPRGVVGVAVNLERDADSPDELLDRIRDRLPTHADVWTRRLLLRLNSVPAPAHPWANGLPEPSVPEPAGLLEGSDQPPEGEPAASAPALPARVAPTPPELAPLRDTASSWMLLAAAACGAGAGVTLGLANELTLGLPDLSIGAVAGAVAGAIGALACRLSRSLGRAR